MEEKKKKEGKRGDKNRRKRAKTRTMVEEGRSGEWGQATVFFMR
jgi:hypothetical protein